MVMMYLNSALSIAFIFPIIVSAISFDSEPLSLSDNLFVTNPLSSIDQLPLDSTIPPPLDLTTDNSLLSSNTLLDGSSNLFANSEISSNPSSNSNNDDDLFWDDSADLNDPLLLASGGGSGCSPPDTILPPARGKSRLKHRRDGGPAECLSPDMTQGSFSSSNDPTAQVPPVMLPQVFDAEKHSENCWQLTLGVLPFAVAGTRENVVRDETRAYGYRVTLANVAYNPRTVYRATVILGRAPFWNGDTLTYCCQTVSTYFQYTMGINCVLLHEISHLPTS